MIEKTQEVITMKSDLLQGLTEEQIAKLKTCKTQEDRLALAKAEGIELTDEQLEAVTGGACNSANIPCPKCNSMDTIETIDFHTGKIYYCNQCFYDWPRD